MLDEKGFLIAKDSRKVDNMPSIERLELSNVEYMTDKELEGVPSGSIFIFDVECYRNFFFVAFKCLAKGKYISFEQSADCVLDVNKMLWVMWRFIIVGFNSKIYDIPIISLAIKGATCDELKEASDFIIQGNNRPFNFEKEYKLKIQKYNHIDLIEVAPLQGSLKLYAGRLHCKRMQDLPFIPEHILTAAEAEIVRPYCCNDLINTELLWNELIPAIKLRNEMTEKYGVDLRSKSDAQIAETVINSELQKVLGHYPKRPKFKDDLILKYNVPDFIKFETPKLNETLDVICNARFSLDANGAPVWPKGLGERIKTKNGWKWELRVTVGNTVYKLGMGGLHSQESSVEHIASENIFIRDNDVASYYPRIILNQGLFPPHLGPAFLEVYEAIVNTRLDAKGKASALKAIDKIEAAGFKIIANSLKIVINGSFGKLGNKWSTLYAPQLLLQVTITGQLALLMLIEDLELQNIECVSGNTDGVISKYHKDRHCDVRNIIKKWEQQTDFQTEETRVSSLNSRDVNSYVAILDEAGNEEARFLDERLGCKTKGAYCEKGSALNSILSKNPESLICSDALISYLKNGTPVARTIKASKDIRRFISVRNVKGGGEKNGVYLGKVVRYYYPKNEKGFIAYVGSGNKVAKSEGARPLMDLPEVFPTDIDYDRYIEQTIDMLYDCGALKHPTTAPLFF